MEIYNSLKYSHHLDVYGASGKKDHASFIYPDEKYIEDKCFYIGRDDFIERLNEHLKSRHIEFIYPTHDSVALFLAENSEALAAKVIGSCAETNRVARSKCLTYRQFSSHGFCPIVYDRPDMVFSYPVFLKPDEGQGGKGAFRVDSRAELDFYLDRFPDLLITEYLPGDELSVDCFTDFRGDLLFIGPRTRERVQMGISFRTSKVDLSDEIKDIAYAINNSLRLNGAWFFQVKKDFSDRYKLLEFAPRQASTMGLYRHTGVNFALLSFFNACGMPINILCNDYYVELDRCLHNRFRADIVYDKVYIDLDETIIDGRYVHDRVMAFIYQCRNQKKQIILITKHRYDLSETLRRSCISKSLFSKIIHLEDAENKWEYIDPVGSIFIDNYWHDRQLVHDALGIPVFDVDAVECLLR
ncbi:ATP-grasp domain-containing protein [Castellaniella sp.]|uniref:ATP-grasp domain-containing protein n=1 Tax=Castellaniella sp. TaxID=1955812 RepID=UPI003C77E89E